MDGCLWLPCKGFAVFGALLPHNVTTYLALCRPKLRGSMSRVVSLVGEANAVPI
jgi:hypothetical protein